MYFKHVIGKNNGDSKRKIIISQDIKRINRIAT
jgi:hypothetical protein